MPQPVWEILIESATTVSEPLAHHFFLKYGILLSELTLFSIPTIKLLSALLSPVRTLPSPSMCVGLLLSLSLCCCFSLQQLRSLYGCIPLSATVALFYAVASLSLCLSQFRKTPNNKERNSSNYPYFSLKRIIESICGWQR